MNHWPEDQQILQKNLQFLAARSKRAVEAIRAASPMEDITFCKADDGGLTGFVGEGVSKRQLASLRAPVQEGERLANTVKVGESACVVVLGFGAGHHVRSIHQRLRQTGIMVVFEPDASLLRGVLSRVDMTDVLRSGNVFVVMGAADGGEIAEVTAGCEGLLAAGTTLVHHPASVVRLGPLAREFEETFTRVMRAVRTNVLTTMVQVDGTVRNLLQNIDYYSECPGIEDLKGCCRGKMGVVVSAGPSLRQNLKLLAEPGVRDRVVIIAVQTVLKTMLREGIRPHFVTALDYHEISKRFYEGLTEEDVRGITLVVEPKANPVIPISFPGTVRIVGDPLLDEVLGPDLMRQMGTIKPGATVAHLAYSLARYIGCDPVVLIGQDLGFTNHQYYGSGAAIHRVWAAELNEFNTLEMLEWQRIARMKSLLRPVPSQRGGTIFTDEQMATYLVQFERDFSEDSRSGLTTIDATEGGVLKSHTTVLTLREALERSRTQAPHALNDAAPKLNTPERRRLVQSRIATLGGQVRSVVDCIHKTQVCLEAMLDETLSTSERNELIDRVHSYAADVGKLPIAHGLIQHVNQVGQFNRFKVDRGIELDVDLPAREKQRRQIQRDLTNMKWLGESGERVGVLLNETLEMLSGQPKRIGADTAQEVGETPSKAAVVKAFISLNLAMGGLGQGRDPLSPFAGGKSMLEWTLAQLAQCEELDGVVIMCVNAEAVRDRVSWPSSLNVEIIEMPASLCDLFDKHVRGIGVARAMARHSWRGGLANMSCYDEALFSPAVSVSVKISPADAVVIVGSDWSCVDPRLVDDIVRRYRQNPARTPMAFSQAPAGLGACLLASHVIHEMAKASGQTATVGSLLGYQPLAPQPDPIVKPSCVQIEPAVRDILVRWIPDSVARAKAIAEVIEARAGAVPPSSGLATMASKLAKVTEVVVFDLVSQADSRLTLLQWSRVIAHLAQTIEDVVVTIRGYLPEHGDSFKDSALSKLVMIAKASGIHVVHVDILSREGVGITEPAEFVKELAATGADIVSIETRPDQSWTSIQATAAAWRTKVQGALPQQWFVPQLVKSKQNLDSMVDWYDRWMIAVGAAVLRPSRGGNDLEPLVIPEEVAERQRWSRLIIHSGGVVASGCGDVVGDVKRETMLEVLERLSVPSCGDGMSAESPVMVSR